MCISLISDESLNQLRHPSSMFSALSFVSTHLNRNLFSGFAALPIGLSPWQPASRSTDPRTAARPSPLISAWSRMSPVERCLWQRGQVGPFHAPHYRWKWHIHPPWQLLRGHRRLTGSMGAATRMHPMRSGDPRWPARLGGVGDPSFQAPISAERIALGVRKGEGWGARPLAACLPAPSSAEMPTPGWSRTTRSRSWAGRRRGATCSTSATGRTSTVKIYIIRKTTKW